MTKNKTQKTNSGMRALSITVTELLTAPTDKFPVFEKIADE